MADSSECLTTAILDIDLDAVVANYRSLLDRLGGVASGAVVKADGYGLGAARIGPALATAGCREFFVAHVSEGIALRRHLPDSHIHILNGLLPGAEAAYREHRLIPVLGSLGEIDAWRGSSLPCDIHVDTGMLRLGLPPSELGQLADDPSRLDGLDIGLVISHLASADEPDSPQNAEQLEAFRAARRILPQGRACLANSSGVFLGADYHFDLARPGVALYGVAPVPGQPNPLQPVVTLKARILQVRDARPPETVGYGAAHAVTTPARIATLGVGYADGYLRSLSGRAQGFIEDTPVPVVGRVSMDLITLDVTAVAEPLTRPGQWVELIGANNPIDAVALAAGTIGYEILTNLGPRYHRTYSGGAD